MKKLGVRLLKFIGVILFALGCVFAISTVFAVIAIFDTAKDMVSNEKVPFLLTGLIVIRFCCAIVFCLLYYGLRFIRSRNAVIDTGKEVKAYKRREKNSESQITNLNSAVIDVSFVDGMDGHDFEYFCADILRKNGFSEVSVTKGSGDQGVDILASKDGIRYAIQCKNYASKLSNTSIQEVNAGKTFYNCHVGVVMTNSVFTPSAIELANSTNVLLWDRDILNKYIKKASKI